MSLRVNPDPSRNLLAAREGNRQGEVEAMQELSSGRKVNSPSEDPAATAPLAGNHLQASATNQFLQSISDLRSSIQVADSTLNSVVLALTRAISLGVEGADRTLSHENRLAIAREVGGVQEHLLGLANTKFQGNQLFAGTAVTTEPYVLDPLAPSRVRYAGNTGVSNVEISDGQSLPINLPGSQIFSQPSADVFQAIHDLIHALETDGDAAAAISEAEKAFNYVNTQRAFYLSTLARLDTAEFFLKRRKLELSGNEDDPAGAGMAADATKPAQAENSLNPTPAAGAKASQLSLLDFLR